MKKIKLVWVVIASFLLCFWMYRNHQWGKEQEEIQFKDHFNEKVFRAYIPETEKSLTIMFFNGQTRKMPYWLRDSILPNDSVKKEINSFRYVVYKNSNPIDSLEYLDTAQLHFRFHNLF